MEVLGEIVKAAFHAIIDAKEWGLLGCFLLIFAWIIHKILKSAEERDKIDLERENKLIDALGKMHENLPAITSGVEKLIDTTKGLDSIVAANVKTTELLGEKIDTLTVEVRRHAETLEEHEDAIKRLEQIEKGDYLEQHN